MKFGLDILRGFVMGIANIIPGVSGGTMMVSMGIYDAIIYSITHIFKKFKNSIKILSPYIIGMLIGIGGGAIALSYLFKTYSLPTNTAFIGLILGGIPAIVKNMDKKKINKLGISIGIIFFLLIILLQILKLVSGSVNHSLVPSFTTGIIMCVIGTIASATMVIPGVSGSMVMILLGYYDSLLSTVSSFISGLKSFDISIILKDLYILIPFGIGVLLGIFFVAKLIEHLLKTYFTYTYCGILGLVIASHVVVIMNVNYSQINLYHIIISFITFIIGYIIATKLADEDSHELVK